MSGFTIIVSQPGYLPSAEPYTVDTTLEAREAVADELRHTADVHELTAVGAVRCTQEWDGTGTLAVELGGYVHEAVPQ